MADALGCSCVWLLPGGGGLLLPLLQAYSVNMRLEPPPDAAPAPADDAMQQDAGTAEARAASAPEPTAGGASAYRAAPLGRAPSLEQQQQQQGLAAWGQKLRNDSLEQQLHQAQKLAVHQAARTSALEVRARAGRGGAGEAGRAGRGGVACGVCAWLFAGAFGWACMLVQADSSLGRVVPSVVHAPPTQLPAVDRRWVDPQRVNLRLALLGPDVRFGLPPAFLARWPWRPTRPKRRTTRTSWGARSRTGSQLPASSCRAGWPCRCEGAGVVSFSLGWHVAGRHGSRGPKPQPPPLPQALSCVSVRWPKVPVHAWAAPLGPLLVPYPWAHCFGLAEMPGPHPCPAALPACGLPLTTHRTRRAAVVAGACAPGGAGQQLAARGARLGAGAAAQGWGSLQAGRACVPCAAREQGAHCGATGPWSPPAHTTWPVLQAYAAVEAPHALGARWSPVVVPMPNG